VAGDVRVLVVERVCCARCRGQIQCRRLPGDGSIILHIWKKKISCFIILKDAKGVYGVFQVLLFLIQRYTILTITSVRAIGKRENIDTVKSRYKNVENQRHYREYIEIF
jgi:hypothetical protein